MNKDIIVVLSETGIQISIIYFIRFNYFVALATRHGVRVCYIYIYLYYTCCTRVHTDMCALFYNNIILLL